MRELKFRAWDSEGHEMSDPMTMRQLLTYSPLDDDSADNLMVMQYTGLHDANGVEIYEGDIVCLASSEKGVVFHNEEWGCYSIRFSENKIQLNAFMSRKHITVIGNIHQNPELVNT